CFASALMSLNHGSRITALRVIPKKRRRAAYPRRPAHIWLSLFSRLHGSKQRSGYDASSFARFPFFRHFTYQTSREVWSQKRRREARDAIAQSDGQIATVHVMQSESPCCLESAIEPLRQHSRQLFAIAFHIELEVESQAARVPVGRTNQRPRVIHEHELVVIERWRRKMDA